MGLFKRTRLFEMDLLNNECLATAMYTIDNKTRTQSFINNKFTHIYDYQLFLLKRSDNTRLV